MCYIIEISTEEDNSNSYRCINCFSYSTKIFDDKTLEIICTVCGCVDDNQSNESYIDEMMKLIYRDIRYKSGLVDEYDGGEGQSLTTSYEKSMDYSKSGLVSGKMSSTDSNNKKVNGDYSKLAYIERNALNNFSTNREANITEGLSTILKISDKLKIPKHVTERSANLFRMFYPKDKEKKIKYINITNLLTHKKHGTDKHVSAKFVSITCLYFALRENQDITSLIEFTSIILKNNCIDNKLYNKASVTKIISKIYNTMVKEFDLPVVYPNIENTINHICNSNSIDETIKRNSITLYKTLNDNVFQGTAPRTIAIVLIYISFIRAKKVPLFLKSTDLSIITLKKLYNRYIDNMHNINEISDTDYEKLKVDLNNGYKYKIA